jgi:RNA polymerase primary sigma factor
MAAKKKSTNKRTKSAKSTRKNVTLTKKKKSAKKQPAVKGKRNSKASKKSGKKATAKKLASKTTAKKPARAPKKKQARKRNQEEQKAFSHEAMDRASGGESGDLQGLSSMEGAESESVDELLEEGNAFEADVVKGVEDADDADEREVRTHEVLEDDVPDEYLEP